MTLLLTSDGISTEHLEKVLLGLLPKPPAISKLLLIALGRTELERSYIEGSKAELTDLGFRDVAVLNLADRETSIDPREYDVIHVCGGNTFAYLDRIRKLGLVEKIIEAVQKGVVYIGVSAGSVIAGPDIEAAGWGSGGDPNDIELKDLAGLNLTRTVVFPHYRDEQQEEVAEFKKRVSYPVVELQDGQALLVQNQTETIIDILEA
jgi:dipeptidase E